MAVRIEFNGAVKTVMEERKDLNRAVKNLKSKNGGKKRAQSCRENPQKEK
ncbi:hypothetical protein NLX69_00235 [Rossellomorea sp. BNER]|nr:hypothetical protein [Rossellomorea sp. BNER]